MKVLVLGTGLQGKALIHDLEKAPTVVRIIAADLDLSHLRRFMDQGGWIKTIARQIDARSFDKIVDLIRKHDPDLVACMLPPQFGPRVARASIECGVSYVSTSYTGELADLDRAARDRGVIVLPEMGMDPGIDLLLCRLAIDRLDSVAGLHSYGGGIPEPACVDDNPFHYKISWTFEGVLNAYLRPARLLEDGRQIDIPRGQIFRPANLRLVNVPGIGAMEASANGDALRYIDAFDLDPTTLRNMGRFTLRWPGHATAWNQLMDLGFLDDEALDPGSSWLSPRQFLIHHLGPRLTYGENERDMVIILVRAWGRKNGEPHQVAYLLRDERDLRTGLFAMNRTVGFTASIAAQMILRGEIRRPGVLSPARDVPPVKVLDALRARGIQISEI